MGRRKVSSTRGGIKNGGKNYFSSTKFHRAINQIIAKLDAMQNQALLDKIDALR